MKVTGQQQPKSSELGAGRTREAEHKTANAEAAQPSVPGKLQSRLSLTLHRLKEAIEAEPEVRSNRVEALRQQIDSGEYSVDAEKLAHNIINKSLHEDVG